MKEKPVKDMDKVSKALNKAIPLSCKDRLIIVAYSDGKGVYDRVYSSKLPVTEAIVVIDDLISFLKQKKYKLMDKLTDDMFKHMNEMVKEDA